MPEPTAASPERREVMAWRRETRERLIAARRALDPVRRRAGDARIAGHLDALLGEARCVSLYWPFRAEPDLRGWGEALVARGMSLALPVVVERAAPLVFRAWRPGDKLVPGIWNIPVPAEGAVVVPDMILAPVVGFDPQGFRLGYGGGYFDRTLAGLAPGWRAYGVGYAEAALPTIHPLPHDVRLDAVVTPEAVYRPAPAEDS